MESRISKIEAIIPMLATREDLAKHEGITRQAIMHLEMTMQAGFERQDKNLLTLQVALQKDINSQTWKFLIWATSLVGMAFSASFFIVNRAS
jgi:DNA-binding XRE family transcriptional regulator